MQGAVVRKLFDTSAEVEQQVVTFDDFWLLYPRRVAKKDAHKAWLKIHPRHHVAILTALVAWRPIWAQKDAEFLPHPATWLNGERWDDELPSSVTHASHVPAAPVSTDPAAPRPEIPAHVQACIDRLRGKR